MLDAAGYDGLRAEQAGPPRARRRASSSASGCRVYVEITGGGDESGAPNENATVEVHPDGTATILTGTSPHGQGHATVWAMLASEELGIPIEKITVKWGDTDLVPRAAAPAARAACSRAARPCSGRPGADRGGQGSGRPTLLEVDSE